MPLLSPYSAVRGVLITCLLCALPADSVAQTVATPHPGPTLQRVVPLRQTSHQTHSGPVACQPACCPPECYWIVSLRCCPQKRHSDSAGCCSRFYHRTPDGCLRPACHAEFLASLTPQVPICLMIHGSYVRWQDVHPDAQKTFCWIRGAAPHLPLNYVYVTWPSDPHLPPFDIQALGRASARNGFYLAQIIQTIPCDHPIGFIGHSHGARLTLSTLHLLAGGRVQGCSLTYPTGASHRFRAVLAAAAIDHDWLNPGERYGCALPITECVMSMRTRKDRALAFYPLRHPFSPASLGRKGFTRRDRRKLGHLGCRVREVDVTCYIGHHHFWQFYNKHPQLAHVSAPYVYFPDVQVQPASAPSN